MFSCFDVAATDAEAPEAPKFPKFPDPSGSGYVILGIPNVPNQQLIDGLLSVNCEVQYISEQSGAFVG